jgi:hypothetical protein
MARTWLQLAGLLLIAGCVAGAQDLAPRAYIIAPVHSNAITLTYSYYSGDVLFAGNIPITGATSTTHVPTFSLFHTLNFFGRSANVTAVLPYGVMNFQGTVLGAERTGYRSGLLDSAFRLAVNLKGGPAMDIPEFAKWRQKTLIGASFKVVAPTGQYDPTKLINLGGNRWGFKPEIGVSQRWGHWILDGYGAVWFFTANNEFFSRNQYNPGVTRQTEQPVGAFEGHLSYDFRYRFWASLDGNFWFGGATSLNGKENSLTEQRNSRLGVTIAIPLDQHQSLKFSYNSGAYISYGGDYKNVSAAWQYSWTGRPK